MFYKFYGKTTNLKIETLLNKNKKMFQRFSNETLSTIYVIQSCDRMKIFLFSLKIKFIFYGRFGRILINVIPK